MTSPNVLAQYKARYGSPFMPSAITFATALLAYQQRQVETQNDAARIAVHLATRYQRELLAAMDSRPIKDDAWCLVHRGNLSLGIPTLWLLGWSEHHGTDVHDHADSQVGLSVLRGRIVENVYDLAGKRTRSRILSLGQTIAAPAPYIHEVHGTAASVALPDVSLHAYWPPLRTQTLFKESDKGLEQIGCWKDDDFITQQCEAYRLMEPPHG